ncbi:MAG TPA: S41 family peptidase [Lysobacter sp.]
MGLLVAPAFAQEAPGADPRAVVLAEALAAIDTRAYNRPRIDWTAVQRTTRETLAAAPGDEGLTAAICNGLRALDDGHSFYRSPGTGRYCFSTSRAHPTTPEPQNGPIAAVATSVRWPRLVVRRWSGPWPQATIAMNELRAALVQATAAGSCGLIVDLRDNTGGNVWPMLAGLAPLYRPGTLQTWVDRDGRANAVTFDGEWLRDGDRPIALRLADMPRIPRPPNFIAVLWGEWTASAGELTALALAGRPDVRSFGVPSVGQTSANTSITLSNGGLLALMGKRVRDRSGRDVDGPLVPDEQTRMPVDAAQAWLTSQCGDAS